MEKVTLGALKNTLSWISNEYYDCEVEVIIEEDVDAVRNFGVFMEDGKLIIKVYKLG